MAPFDDVGYTDPATGINYPPPSQTMKAKSPIPGLGNYPNYSASTQQYLKDNPVPSSAGIPTMTLGMIAPLYDASETTKTYNNNSVSSSVGIPTMTASMIATPSLHNVSQTPKTLNLGGWAPAPYSPTNPHQLPPRNDVSPLSFSLGTRKPSPSLKSTYKAPTSVPQSTVSPFTMKGTVGSAPPPSFVSQNNGGSFSFAASISGFSSTAAPVTNPYAGMNSGMGSWTMAGSDAKPSSGRPRSDWRTGKEANPSDVFAANLFPELAKVPQFGQTNAPGQNLFGPSVGQTISAVNQAPSPPPPNDDTTMEETTAVPAQISSQPTIEGPSAEMGEASPTPAPTPTSFFLPAPAATEGAGFKFSAQARLNPGRSPISKAEKSQSSRNHAGRQGLSFGSPTSKLASSFAPRLDHLSIDPQLMGQSQPPPPPPPDAFIGPQLPVQPATPAFPSNGNIVPQSSQQRVSSEETTISNLKSQHQREKAAIQAQLSSMKADVEQSKNQQMELQTQLSDSKTTVEKSRKQHLMMQTQLSKSKVEVEQSRKQQTDLQSQISNMTDGVEQSKLHQAELQTQLSKSKVEVEQSRTQQTELQSQVSHMTAAADQSRLQQVELQKQVSNLQNEVIQYQSQAQEIAELKSALARNDKLPGKYDWVKDNTIKHQRTEIESLNKQRNFHRKTADELQRARKAALRSDRDFRVLEKKIETLEDEKTSWQKKYEKNVEDMANRMAKIEARFEEKRVKMDQSAQSLRKELREAKAKDNYVRAEAAEKKNVELLEGVTVLQQSYTEARAAAKEAEEKAKDFEDHAEEERKALIKGGYDVQLAEKVGLIADKDELVLQKTEKIMELEGIIEKKEQLLETLGADTVSRMNAEIVELQITMNEKERAIETLETDIVARDTHIIELKSQKARLRNELRDKFTPKLDKMLMTPIEPLPTLKHTSLPPSLVEKLTAMVAEENAANPLSISKVMMVAEIQPTKEEPARENRGSNSGVSSSGDLEGNNKGEKQHDEASNESKLPSDVVTSVAEGKWTRSFASCARIFFFLMGVLMVFITSAVIDFHSRNRFSDNANPISTYLHSLNKRETPIPGVVLRHDDAEVFVLDPKKLDLPFETTKTVEYIDIIIDLEDMYDESDFYKQYNTYKPKTELHMDSDPEPNAEQDTEPEDSSQDQAYEAKLDLMFLGAGVVICLLMSSIVILERGL